VYVVLILLAGIGLSLFVYYSHVNDPSLPIKDGKVQADGVFPHFVATRLPVGFAGLLMAAIMAASSMTPGINTIAGVLTLDFHRRARPGLTPADQLRWARRYALLVGLASTLLAGLLKNTGGLYNLIQVILGVFAGPLLACMVIAMQAWRVSGRSMAAGLLAGSAAGIVATQTSLAALWVAPLAAGATALTSIALSAIGAALPSRPVSAASSNTSIP
jgi:SSS family solute:Na+ symporter